MYSTYPTFQIGNTRIITMENFEALGRYITAKEQAEKFARERNDLLKKAKDLIDRSSQGYSGVTLAYEFDPTPILDLLSKATETDKNLRLAVDEANRQADLCGKHKLSIQKPYY
jgi:hypothetical protein